MCVLSAELCVRAAAACTGGRRPHPFPTCAAVPERRAREWLPERRPRDARARESLDETRHTPHAPGPARDALMREPPTPQRADVMTIERGHTRNTSMAHNVMALETSTQRASSRFPHYAVPPVPVRPSRRACARAPRPLHAQLHQYTRPACLVLLAWGTLTRPWGSSPSSPRRVWARRAQPA